MNREHEIVTHCEARRFEPEKDSNNKDVIIVGAGVAGSALAHTLGKEGYQVHLIERNLSEPNRIVGEVLQPGGYLKLIELGLEDCVNEIDAQKVLGYALYKDGKSVIVPYPMGRYSFHVSGRSFHHGRFVQKLRTKGASLANVRMEQGTVTSLIQENGIIKGVKYQNKIGQCITAQAPLTIICDGCFSNLRRFLCKPKVDVLSNCVVLILKNCQLQYTNYAHAIFEGPSFIMFYRISKTEVRCLIDIPGEKLPCISNGDMANYLKTVVVPEIPLELQSAFISSVDEGQIRTMPLRSMPAKPYPIEGAILVGDALNMRHPLTGSGMMVALNDIVLLRDILRMYDLSDTTAPRKFVQCFYSSRKVVACTADIIASVSYGLISSEVKEEVQRLCFDCMSLERFFSRGVVAVVSGIEHRPLNMALYLIFLAIYFVFRVLCSISSPKGLWSACRLVLVVTTIIFPIAMDGVKQLFH